MFCPKCGKSVPEGSKFCETCGNNMQQTERENVAHSEEPQEVSTETENIPEHEVKSESTEPDEQPVIEQKPQAPVYQAQPQAQSYQQQSNYQPQPESKSVYRNNGTNGVDPREKVYSVWGWLGTYLLLLIPIVNLIMPFVWAFSSKTNKNKKNWAIASLVIGAVMLILGIVLYAAIATFFNSILNQIGGYSDFGDLGGIHFPE